MTNFDQKPSLEEANKTLQAHAGLNQEEYIKQQQEQAARAYSQTQSQGEAFSQGNPVFNANGTAENPSDNIIDEQDLRDQEIPAQEDDYVEQEQGADQSKIVAELNDLRAQVEVLKKQVAAEHEARLLALADSENIRKRSAQDVDRAKKFALEGFVKSLLPIYDALEKALEMTANEEGANPATVEGVQNTLNLFVKELASFGVEIVDPTNQPFDPNFHQAIQMIPSPEVKANHVINTFQKGFTLNGRVVRAAMVLVSSGAPK